MKKLHENQMKKRYYFSMASIFLLILSFDGIYFILHKALDIFLITTAAHFVLFGIINLFGSIYFYKPIDQIFSDEKTNSDSLKKISRLSWFSTLWVFIIGIIYVVLSLFLLFYFSSTSDTISTETMPPIFYLSMFSSSIYVFAIFPAFFTYFLINDFILDLKMNAFMQFKLLFPVGKKKVGTTLILVFIILGFLPAILVILDLFVFAGIGTEFSQFTSFDLLGSVLIDRFIVIVGMFIAIIFVTRSFTKPIYSLVEAIKKVKEGDYSTQTALIAEDEISQLTQNFNEMVSELNSSYKKQEEYSRNLELNLEKLNKEIVDREQAEEIARQQQKKLFQSEKMASVGILVSGVAHEINNPNNFILLNSENLSEVWNDFVPILDKYYENHGDFVIAGLNYSEIRDEVSMIINGIKEGSERIKKIVQTLKDFARKDPGNLDQIVNLSTVIEDSITILTGLIKKSTNNFSTKIPKDLPSIRGNIQQIEQVIINLISNACHSLEDRNKEIKLSVEKVNNSIQINILDEGVGIPSENLKYIMDPFFTTKRDTGGTGLGLSISYNIIKDHGGELIFDSIVGKGTTFSIRLPIS